MKKQTFLKGSLILMASAASAKVLGAVFKIPLTNILGGVGMSYFSCAYSLFMPVYALIVTGISSAVARMVARSAALGLYGNARRIRNVAMIVFTAAGIPGSLLMAVLAVPFSLYSVNGPEAAPAVAMIAPAVFLGCITAVERGYYEGLSNMYPTAVSQVTEGVVKVFAGLWLCGYVTENSGKVMRLLPGVADVRALAAAAGILGVTLSSAGAVLFFGVLRLFVRPHEDCGGHLDGRREIARGLVREALPIGASAVVTNLTALIDMWTVIGCLTWTGGYAGRLPGIPAGEVPRFVYGSFAGIALTVFNLVPSVTNMLGKGALTCIAGAKECGGREEIRRGTLQALLAAETIAVPAAVGMGLFAPELLGALFPRQSDEVSICVGALRLLMPGMVCLCMAFPLFSMLQAVGRAGAPLKIMLAGTGVKLAGNLLLIPVMGINGAALSTSVCYVLILASATRTYLRCTGISLGTGAYIKVLYAGAMCGGAAYLSAEMVSRTFQDGAIVRLAAAALTGGAVYAAAFYALFRRELPSGRKCLSCGEK
jgi:stage V sporulation protein B